MKIITKITDPGKRAQLQFADLACVQRQSESGLDLMPIGPLATAVRVGEGTPVLVYNGGASVAFVSFGDGTVASPSSPANGVPIAPGEKYMLNSGPNAWVRASSASVFGYTGDNTDK